MKPSYTAHNIRIGDQLNYSLTLFSNPQLPEASQWFEALRLATAGDKICILEYRTLGETPHLFLAVRTRPIPWEGA